VLLVMDTIREAGISRVALVTLPLDETPGQEDS
jgi:biopolymer transport protein ExbD